MLPRDSWNSCLSARCHASRWLSVSANDVGFACERRTAEDDDDDGGDGRDPARIAVAGDDDERCCCDDDADDGNAHRVVAVVVDVVVRVRPPMPLEMLPLQPSTLALRSRSWLLLLSALLVMHMPRSADETNTARCASSFVRWQSPWLAGAFPRGYVALASVTDVVIVCALSTLCRRWLSSRSMDPPSVTAEV